MVEKKYVMGNTAITRGAVESGVSVVAGYPGTPATEILEGFTEYLGIHAEWSCNEKVALEVALGASLSNVRAMAVMKHNGTNVSTDILMHLNFTGIAGGLVLISADDPGGLSSQNEEDSRILVHTYANLPVFDPCSAIEAKAMIKDAYELSERTQACFVLRPVMRVCHSRAIIPFEAYDESDRKEGEWKDDRDRFIMSAVEVRDLGGIKRPQARHRWLNHKYIELQDLFEESPYNHIEEGDGQVGIIGCGIGYTYFKEVESLFPNKYPILKLGTLPIPKRKVIAFLRDKEKVVVFEEVEPVVENLIKLICQEHGLQVEVLGRSGFYPSDGELTAQMVLEAVKKAVPGVEMVDDLEPNKIDFEVPIRTRTQCVGCAYRGLLYNIKRVSRKNKGVVFGDIGCHDAGSFKPLELQSTIYCMGSSVPMATGAYFADLKRPIFSIMGDSTFFHLGLNGLINASYQNAKQIVILCDNSTTAMTGFQPHAGSGKNLHGNRAKKIDIEKIGEAINVKVRHIDAYDIKATYATLKEAVDEEGVSLIVSSSPCYLKGSKEEIRFFEPKEVHVEPEECNGCMICINDFGCPALIYDPDENKVHADKLTCVECGLCIQVCKRGAIS